MSKGMNNEERREEGGGRELIIEPHVVFTPNMLEQFPKQSIVESFFFFFSSFASIKILSANIQNTHLRVYLYSHFCSADVFGSVAQIFARACRRSGSERQRDRRMDRDESTYLYVISRVPGVNNDDIKPAVCSLMVSFAVTGRL